MNDEQRKTIQDFLSCDARLNRGGGELRLAVAALLAERDESDKLAHDMGNKANSARLALQILTLSVRRYLREYEGPPDFIYRTKLRDKMRETVEEMDRD